MEFILIALALFLIIKFVSTIHAWFITCKNNYSTGLYYDAYADVYYDYNQKVWFNKNVQKKIDIYDFDV